MSIASRCPCNILLFLSSMLILNPPFYVRSLTSFIMCLSDLTNRTAWSSEEHDGSRRISRPSEHLRRWQWRGDRKRWVVGLGKWLHGYKLVMQAWGPEPEHPESTWKPHAYHDHLQFPWRREIKTGDFLQLCGPASWTKAVENTQEGLSQNKVEGEDWQPRLSSDLHRHHVGTYPPLSHSLTSTHEHPPHWHHSHTCTQMHIQR